MYLILKGGAMLDKSLIQFSVDEWCSVPSLLFALRPSYGGGDEDNGNLLKRSLAGTAAVNAPNAAAGHHQPTPPLQTPGNSRASLDQSLVGSLLLSPGSWCTQAFVCVLQESASSVLCEFLQLYGGVNGDLLQAGLCHTQVNCTQSPYPCSSPVMTHTSTEDTPTQFWLSLCVVSGSWCTQGLLELSEHLWLAWSLILNVIPPLLPSFWVFFVLKVSFFVGSNILLLMIVQLRGVILEFSQEKISTHHSTPP